MRIEALKLDLLPSSDPSCGFYEDLVEAWRGGMYTSDVPGDSTTSTAKRVGIRVEVFSDPGRGGMRWYVVRLSCDGVSVESEQCETVDDAWDVARGVAEEMSPKLYGWIVDAWRLRTQRKAVRDDEG